MGQMENSGTLEMLRNNLLFIHCSTVGLEKITMPCLKILYCSVCESNESFCRKEHQMHKWILENQKASESNNCTFKVHLIWFTFCT